MEYPGMKRWENRIALVTGAGSGIGACIAKKLVSYGMIVVGCARNIEPIKKMQAECLNSGYKGTLHPYQCDLQKDSEIDGMFQWIKNIGGGSGSGVDICINNAGYTTGTSLLEVSPSDMRAMLETNVVALVRCAQLAISSMLKRKVNDGHVVNVNSVLGHEVLGVFNFYAATKFAVTAITKGFRKELIEKGVRIKVTSISPGRTETGFLHSAYGTPKAQEIYSQMENLTAEDVANSLLHTLSSPPHTYIGDILIEPIQPTPKGSYNK